jgi:hypothetical protein
MNFSRLSIIYLLLVCFLALNTNCIAQQKQNKFFISAGFGLAGSFFVRSYVESSPISQNKVFEKKKFVGTAQNGAIGFCFKKDWEVRAGINYQHFTRWVNSRDTLNNIQVIFNNDIHHRDYMWYGAADRKLDLKKNRFVVGLGLYYLVSKTQTVEIYPGYVISDEQIWKGSYNGELGVVTEVAYEYKFQPKVNIGLKGQFYYTITAAYAESVTLFPYIKILF